MNDFDIPASFWDHVEELRITLIRIIATIVCGIILCLFFYQDIFNALQLPIKKIFSSSQQEGIIVEDLKRQKIVNYGSADIKYQLPPKAWLDQDHSEGVRQISPGVYFISPKGYLHIERPAPKLDLLVFGPIEGITTTLKVCFWVGLVGTSPLWAYLALQFISPALRGREKSLIIPFVLMSLLFVAIGFFFAFFVTIPLANKYLYAFNADIGVNQWSLSNYLDYTIFLLLANGVAFELSLILFFLVHLGILNAEIMCTYRRWMIVMAFVLGAFLTPPDIPSQIMLAVPLIVLYEISILYARWRERGLRIALQD